VSRVGFDGGTMPTKEELGRRLKAVRIQRGPTLKDVESRSGVSMTHTSQIERGMTSPTIGALEKLARALDKTLPYFVEDRPISEVSVIRKGERNIVRQEKGGITVEALTGGITGGGLQFYHVTMPVGGRETRSRAHAGEECAVVLRGTLEVGVGDERHLIRAGESIHFKATSPHYLRNAGKTQVEAIWASDQNPLF
jgi:transcriptional regulator with XRE-family HTH domain